MTIKCATWDACSNSQIIIDSYHNKYTCVIYSDTWYCNTEVIRPRVPSTSTPNPTPNPTKRPSIYPSKNPSKQPSIYPITTTQYPSKHPSKHPSTYPTQYPSASLPNPSKNSSIYPSTYPTQYPSTSTSYSPNIQRGSDSSAVMLKHSSLPPYIPWFISGSVLICIVALCVLGTVLVHFRKLSLLNKERNIVHIVVGSKSNNIDSLKTIVSEPDTSVIVYNVTNVLPVNGLSLNTTDDYKESNDEGQIKLNINETIQKYESSDDEKNIIYQDNNDEIICKLEAKNEFDKVKHTIGNKQNDHEIAKNLQMNHVDLYQITNGKQLFPTKD